MEEAQDLVKLNQDLELLEYVLNQSDHDEKISTKELMKTLSDSWTGIHHVGHLLVQAVFPLLVMMGISSNIYCLQYGYINIGNAAMSHIDSICPGILFDLKQSLL